jgi:two-component system OmpR family response regulator
MNVSRKNGRVRLLVVAGEPELSRLLRGLREQGHPTDVASRGAEGVRMANPGRYEAIVVDVMLADGDGLEIVRRLRALQVWTPVIILAAGDAVADRVAGLDAGADDYLTKPFAFEELLARLRAIVRRGQVERPAVIEVGDLRLDPASRRLWRHDEEIELSAREFGLLELFMRHPGRALTRLQLLEGAWDMAYENRSNVVDVYVRNLREKIDRPFARASLETVRGIGYRLREDGR